MERIIAGRFQTKGELDLGWLDIRPAARAAWDRVDRSWYANP